ncbi:hypothetical protein FM106_30585 [Brachybacterium faecium]|nr:hypothetical protein FM106_30585 [Brachybacterium faecium]
MAIQGDGHDASSPRSGARCAAAGGPGIPGDRRPQADRSGVCSRWHLEPAPSGRLLSADLGGVVSAQRLG